MEYLKENNRKFYLFLGFSGAAMVAVAVLAPRAFKVLALSFGLAYLLDPAVDWLERRKVPRSLSILLILAAVITVLVVLFSLVAPYLWHQGVAFIREAPDLTEKAADKLVAWGVAPKGFSISLPRLASDLGNKLLSGGMDYISPIAKGLFRATSGLLGTVLVIVNFIIVPVFFFYIIRDLDQIKENFFSFVPTELQEGVRDYLSTIDGVLGGFIRGQIVVAMALAVLYSAGLLITGIRFGVVIGVAAGLLSVIPYVGFFVGILASSVVVLVDFSGWGMVLGVVATFTVSQLIEGYILTPRLVGNKVGLNPLETLVAVLVGGEIGGFIGLLIAIPSGGVFKKTLYFLKEQDSEGPVPHRENEVMEAGEDSDESV